MDHVKNVQSELNKILTKINSDYCDIRYSVYRTALKLCRLQSILHLHEINATSVLSSIKSHILWSQGPVDFITNEVVNFKKLHQVIIDIYKSCGVHNLFDTSKLCKYVTILIFETFKNVKQANVSLISVALFFIVMGNDEIKTKYKSLFSLYAGALAMLNKSRAGLLITHFVRITETVSESGSFGKITPSVESCFRDVLGSMVSQHHFLQWLLKEPQSIVWLPTMHRLNISRSSVHNVQCATCKVRPIIGLRFQCLKCLDYDTCQTCFLTQQRGTKSHKVNHPRQEYCLPAGSKEKVNAFARTIRNIVTKRYKHKSLSSSFLPIDQSKSDPSITLPQSLSRPEENGKNTSKSLNDSADYDEVSHLANEEKEQLMGLVTKLKEENEKILGTVHLLESSQNEKVDGEEDNLILQNQLDTVMLHNHHLKAELDNLKCVVFAENFLHDSQSGNDGSSLREENGETTEGNMSDISSLQPEPTNNLHRGKKFKHKQKSTKPHKVYQDMSLNGSYENNNLAECKQENDFSEQLRHILDSLGSALVLDNLPPPGGVNHEMSVAAEKVTDNFNDLIDQALAS
ncbi:dystrophin-like [Clavelina lepadiformis]|uniref:dystrophin-like n=1 Tax=Clavelina lepadiformis TaxID=159417 RepID=UPI004041E0D3